METLNWERISSTARQIYVMSPSHFIVELFSSTFCLQLIWKENTSLVLKFLWHRNTRRSDLFHNLSIYFQVFLSPFCKKRFSNYITDSMLNSFRVKSYYNTKFQLNHISDIHLLFVLRVQRCIILKFLN